MSKLNIQLHAWQPGRISANVIVSADALPTHMTFSFLGTHSLEASAFTKTRFFTDVLALFKLNFFIPSLSVCMLFVS